MNFEDENDKSWLVIIAIVLIGIVLGIYYFIDTKWLNPKKYAEPSAEDVYYESQEEDFYAP